MKCLIEEKNEIKKILKLKKQNDIKLEDIICNIYNFFFLSKFSSCNYQFCFC